MLFRSPKPVARPAVEAAAPVAAAAPAAPAGAGWAISLMGIDFLHVLMIKLLLYGKKGN